jgi:hypothetical protein
MGGDDRRIAGEAPGGCTAEFFLLIGVVVTHDRLDLGM